MGQSVLGLLLGEKQDENEERSCGTCIEILMS
jgi:hypothetical protein